MENRIKVVIFTADSNGGYPVPAVKGGAVSTLVEHLVRQNENKQLIDLTVVSLYDKAAEPKAKIVYPHIDFIWIKTPKIVKVVDKVVYFAVRKIFKKKKTVSYISMMGLIDYIFKASRHLKKVQYDKVILENNVPMAWIIKLSKYKGDYYYHFHNVPRINAKCKEVFDNAKGYLCVSDYVARQIQSEDNPIGPIKPEKTKVLYNCVDTKLFRKIDDTGALDQERRKFGIGKDNKVAVFVGRLSEEKGIDKLLEAVPLVKEPKLKVLIVGSLIYNQRTVDDYQLKLRELAEKAGDQVTFTGYIDQDELPFIYNIADVAVLPSMWDEPAGLTMVEAMACGTPVITTKSGGIPEYVGKYGITLDRDDELVGNIAQNIDRVLAGDKKEKTLDSRSIIDSDNTADSRILHVRMKFSSGMYLENFKEQVT